MKTPRVLIISNQCLSQSSSNGRTLGNLLNGWPKEQLAQFCVIAKDPDWNLCDNYYCLEDRTVLHSFLHQIKAIGRKLIKENGSNNAIETKPSGMRRKTLLKVFLRELVWSNKRWNSKCFKSWVADFNPNVVVLQFGDTFFTLDIAYEIATIKNIPLVIYNTEGYYFFPRNWHHQSILDKLLFPIYKGIYSKKVERVMDIAKHCVYLNDKLKNDYDHIFGCSSTVIYNSSSIEPSDLPFFIGKYPKFCYLGNLGLDRDSALVEIGEVLLSINREYAIDVYGNADDHVRQRLISAPGVNYCGLVSYEDVKNIISESDILFHVETEKGYKERQLQYAFTTKIADSVSSGRCFLVYAPDELACSSYIKYHKCGWTASSKEELRKVIISILSDEKIRTETIGYAKDVAVRNHNLQVNAQSFQNILLTV